MSPSNTRKSASSRAIASTRTRRSGTFDSRHTSSHEVRWRSPTARKVPLVASNVVMVRVGLCGFTMAIEDYPLRFPVVEVQQTFYQPPRDETMRGWLAATPKDFEFTLKAWQLVTHPGASPTYRRTTRPL